MENKVMKKINVLVLLLICVLSLLTLVGCKDENTLVVGATSAPHAEILEFAKPLFCMLLATLFKDKIKRRTIMFKKIFR